MKDQRNTGRIIGRSARGSDGSDPAGTLVKNTYRRFVVFSTLICVLTLTCALLLALAPAPLAGDSTTSLFAISQPDSINAVFQTRTSCENSRWKHIFVHHSRTPGGNALAIAQPGLGVGDHFVIGNGDGAVDGEIQVSQRWDEQQPAIPPVGSKQLSSDCISICLIGDFDHARPTALQLTRLNRLVAALQTRFQIDPSHVTVLSQPQNAAGIGRYFPAAAFREQLVQ
jgi:hypothetical protein